MKKTLFAITMAAFTAMSLAACGSGSGKTDTTAAAGTEAAKEAGDAKKEETGAPAAAASGDSIKLTWSEVNGEDYGATVGAKEFAKKIEELSGGQITVELYLNGTLGNEKESMQGIQMGTLDIFRGNASSLSNYGADKISLSGLPFLFKDMDPRRWRSAAWARNYWHLLTRRTAVMWPWAGSQRDRDTCSSRKIHIRS